MHGLALSVDGPAVGQDGTVGRPALYGDGGQERRLEPAPVLVAALEVEVAGPDARGVELH